MLTRRIFFLNVVLLIIPMCLITVALLQKSKTTVIEETELAYSSLLSQIELSTENLVAEAVNLAELIAYNAEVQQIASATSEKNLTMAENIDYYNKLTRQLSYLKPNPYFQSIRLFFEGSPIYMAGDNTFLPLRYIQESPVFEEFHQRQVSYLVAFCDELASGIWTSDRNLVLLVPIRAFYAGNPVIGAVAVEINLNVFEDTIRTLNLPQDSVVYFQDRSMKLLYTTNRDFTPNAEFAENLTENSPDGFFRFFLDEEYIAFFKTTRQLGWHLSISLRSSEFLGKFKDVVYLALLLMAAVFAFFFPVAYGFMRKIKRRLSLLKKMIRKVEEGQYGSVTPLVGKDELTDLQAHLNRMSVKIKTLVEEVYTAQITRQRLELNLLESQIKPHFIYNTLDTIAWMARLEGNPKIFDITYSFTKYLRLNLSRGKDYAPLQEEVEGIRQYINILNIRYEDQIRLEVAVPEELNSLPVLKHLLQPLVENAVKHGINQKESLSGTIALEARRVGDFLRVSVSDDGPGLDEQDMGYAFLENERGYGLYNVRQRIELNYGSESKISLERADTGGLKAVLSLHIPTGKKLECL